MSKETDRIVPDTSAIIEGILSKKLESKEIKVKEILIHEAVLSELEHQSNMGRAIGYLGLDELDKLRELSKTLKFEINYSGKRPHASEIKHASLGEIDALIRDLAWEQDATLFTSDKIQSRVAEAKGIKHIYIEPEVKVKKLKLEKFFDERTMSVHLRENVVPIAKKGVPGNWQFVRLDDKTLDQEEVKEISKEIIEIAKMIPDGFIEMARRSSTIVQLKNFRIVITRPPFSDGWEITAVRPVKKMSLKEYDLSEKLTKRISEQAEGILIAGAPGMGKSTFAGALIEHYSSFDKICKTIEAPRDLVLPETITQYAISHGTTQEMHDILLLSRPDYTLFDEMRNTADFELFADLRLSGIGLLGVLHATNPIDAIQRFVGRIELGVIPQVIDTVIFIKNGTVNKVLQLKMTVKVPSGMTEADLARPVVEVRNFEDNALEFEIYSYGEETVVIPVSPSTAKAKKSVHGLAEKELERFFQKISTRAKAEMVSDNKAKVYIPNEDIAKIIGKQGKNISDIEKKLGLSIQIEALDGYNKSGDGNEQKVDFRYNQTGKFIVLQVDVSNTPLDIYSNNQYVLTATSSKNGEIKIQRKAKIGKTIEQGIKQNKVELKISEN